MKRLSILLIILIASLLLLSCGENDSSHGEKDGNNSGGTSADSSENGGNENNENVNDGAFDGIDDVIDYGDNMNGQDKDLINGDGTFTMIATVSAVSEYLEVEVVSAPYGNVGPFWVIISAETKFADADGSSITKSDIKPGDRVKITYGGQVMMSFPPKIAAYSVTVEK